MDRVRSCRYLGPKDTWRILIGALAVLAALVVDISVASARTEVGKPREGRVCFGYAVRDQQCVKILSGTGKLGEGPFEGATEWIVEVQTPEGRTISRVGAGGDIVVISPEAFAKRDAGRRTYAIERIDGRMRPVRTEFVAVATFLRRTGWASWDGPPGAVGMTAMPGPPQMGYQETNMRGRIKTAGRITGIARDGGLTDSYDGVVAVQYYTDFNVLSYAQSPAVGLPYLPNGRLNPDHRPAATDHQVTDADFRSVSPRTSGIVAFLPAFLRQYMGRDAEFSFTADNPTPPLMFGVERGITVAGQKLYALLPRHAGTPSRPDFLGVIALDNRQRTFREGPHALAEGQVVLRVAAFAGVWATPAGPEMTFLRFNGEPFDDVRYRSITWTGNLGGSGILEAPSGTARLIMPVAQHWGPDFDISAEVFPNKSAALTHVRTISAERERAYWAKIAEDRARDAAAEAERERQRAAWAADQQRQRDQLAALERAEAARMRDLVRLDASQWRTVCSEAYAMVTYYAQAHAIQHCSAIRPTPAAAPQKQDFWGSLAAALDGWSSLAAAGAGRTSPASSPSAGVSPDWNYARSARAIDNTVRTVTDPNWNGAAVRATPR